MDSSLGVLGSLRLLESVVLQLLSVQYAGLDTCEDDSRLVVCWKVEDLSSAEVRLLSEASREVGLLSQLGAGGE